MYLNYNKHFIFTRSFYLLTVSLSIIALVTAAISAMIGMGGGLVLIAVFFSVGLAPALALPMHAAIQLVSNGGRAAMFLRYIKWRALLLFFCGVIPMPLIMAPWVTATNPDVLRLIMAAFILLSLWPVWARHLHLHGRWGMLAAGMITGTVSTLVGGGGAVVAPFFLRKDWSKENIIATMAVGSASGHLMKVFAFSINGCNVFSHLSLLVPLIVATVAGTFIGKHVNASISEHGFRILFRTVLALLALKLLWDGLSHLL